MNLRYPLARVGTNGSAPAPHTSPLPLVQDELPTLDSGISSHFESGRVNLPDLCGRLWQHDPDGVS